jgi:type III pantothenate kinase
MKKRDCEFLLIDAGNTRVKWATAGRTGPIKVAGDLSTSQVTEKSVAALARKFKKHVAILSCVVPKMLPTFRKAFGERLVVVNSEVVDRFQKDFGFRYPKPSELGADRIAAAVAAHGLGFHPAIVIACGTATAFTVIDAKGRLCGGAIAPGLQAQLEALLGATAQLPATKLRMPRSALARSTRDAISAGVLLSFKGGVKEILAGLLKTLPARPKPTVLLTGGNAHLLANELGADVKLHPLLIFEGLLMIGRHRSKTSHS